MKRLIGVITLLLWSVSTYAQSEEQVEIYFEQGSSSIDKDNPINANMLNRLSNKLTKFTADSTITISKIEIDSYTSPEGELRSNNNLSQRRTKAVRDFIDSLELNLPASLFEIKNSGVAWDELRQIVSLSDMPDKAQVVKIIDEVPEETWAKTPTSRWLKLVDSRNKHLMDLRYGNPYRYMMANIYPNLRRSSVVTVYFKRELPRIIESVVEPTAEIAPEQPSTSDSTSEQDTTSDTDSTSTSEQNSEITPLFAIKTNLLFDALTILNIELEVPIGNRWSVVAEWIFPWWTWDDGTSDSKRNRIQMLSGNIEGRYWFGDRSTRPVMTGWNAGLYAGGGLYDLERNGTGYQGEFFIAAGLSGGYAHTINKCGSLRMEYSLGIGYLKTDYEKYVAEYYGTDDWRAVRTQTGVYSWFGPTKARVSLVWLLGYNKKTGGSDE
ncbi:MAG: DUF3575 domain-containing protein [Rikenellaceae bacterium]